MFTDIPNVYIGLTKKYVLFGPWNKGLKKYRWEKTNLASDESFVRRRSQTFPKKTKEKKFVFKRNFLLVFFKSFHFNLVIIASRRKLGKDDRYKAVFVESILTRTNFGWDKYFEHYWWSGILNLRHTVICSLFTEFP